MNNSEIFDIQRRLFEEIQKIIPAHRILVEIISDVLDTGRDSAYRRIRCEKLLNIKELHVLCQHFHISFDMLAGIKNIRQFDCTYRPINISIHDEYYQYMLSLSKNVEKLKTSSDSSILMSTMDIPMFHLIEQKELTFFKLYTWAQSVYDYKGSINDFMKEIETPELLSCYQKIISNYELVPSTEIWTENSIHTTLKLIGYYVDIYSFPNKELPLLLCEQVLNIVNKLQKWTENGMKGERTTAYKLYVSEMEPENTYILMKQSGATNCVVKLYTINSLNVFDEAFCREAETWLTKLAKRSVLLCGSSEKERIKFFNLQRQNVRLLMEKIQHSF